MSRADDLARELRVLDVQQQTWRELLHVYDGLGLRFEAGIARSALARLGRRAADKRRALEAITTTNTAAAAAAQETTTR